MFALNCISEQGLFSSFESMKTVLKALAGWSLAVGFAMLGLCNLFDESHMWLQAAVRVGCFLLAIIAFLVACYQTFVCSIIGLEKMWKGKQRILVVSLVIGICVVGVFLYQIGHWYRAPNWDQHSPDGRYTIRAYGDRYFFSTTPGDGSSRKAKVELVENATGKVIGTGLVHCLWAVGETCWHTNCVEVTRGDESLEFVIQ